MNFLKSYLLNKFAVDYNKLSKTKKIAVEAWDKFSAIAQPEIQTSFMATIWEIIKNYGMKKTLEKNDSELKIKMLDVLKIFKPLLDEVNTSIEIQQSESLGSTKVPRVGELGKIAEKFEMSQEEKKKASQILAELMQRNGTI